MNILETVLNSQGGAAVEQLGAQFGLPPEKTQSALAALVPALAAGVQRNVSSQGGLESLLSALTTGGHERYLEDPTLLTEPETTQDGNGILGHLFGSKEVSRQVAQRASERTGIGTETLKRMLPLVATMVMGGLARNARPTDSVEAPAKAGGIMAMLSPLLDQNRDGSMVDDVLGMAGRFFGGRATS